MSVHRWPDTLPQASAPGFGLSPVEQSIRTNMEAGAQRVRRRTLQRLDRMTVEWRFTETEFTAFRAWAESAAYSLVGGSDELNWTISSLTRSIGVALSPDGIVVDRILETVTNSQHRASKTILAAAVDNEKLVFSATIKAAGRTRARLFERDGLSVLKSVDVNLTTGVLSNATGVDSSAILDRGNGWWRVTLIAGTSAGATAPEVRIDLLNDSSGNFYAGDITKGLDVCEVQARLSTGYDLFVPTETDGKALGSDGGSAWFYLPVASGGGLTTAEARFTGPYKVSTMSGLRRAVTAEVEVRSA